ncbi:hypothetical protein ABK040_001059 [Willaertia magna]
MRRLKIDLGASNGNLKSRDYDITQSGSFTKGNFKVNMDWKGLSLVDLQTLGLLGQGSSGSVYLARHIPSGQLLALKFISVFDDMKRKTITNELQTLYSASSEYLIGFFGAFYQEGNFQLALEYMEGGSISDILKTIQTGIPELYLSHMIHQVLLGLRYLHKDRHLVHRDLKPGNVLFNSKGQFKISDFGVSAELDNTGAECATFVGTVTYMSPERLEGQKYSYASDIWALGVIVLESVTGRFPFRDENDQPHQQFWVLLNAIKNGDPPSLNPKDGYSFEVCDFISRCLQKDPKQRASTVDLLEHPFIKKSLFFTEKEELEYLYWINHLIEVREQQSQSKQTNIQNKLRKLEL